MQHQLYHTFTHTHLQNFIVVSQRMLLFLSLLLAILISDEGATAKPEYQYATCWGDDYAPNSTYETNLHTLLSTLTSKTHIDYGFYNSSFGDYSDQVYATALCRGDITPETCRSCINDTTSLVLKQCTHQKAAEGLYDKCVLHYSSSSIFGYDPHEYDEAFNLYYVPSTTNVTDWYNYNDVLTKLLSRLEVKAATNDSHPNRKFAAGKAAVGGVQTIYAVVQCSPDVTVAECNDCLNGAFSESEQYCDKKSGCAFFKLKCNFRYQNSSFYEPTADELTLESQLSPQGSPLPTPISPSTNSSHASHHGIF